MANVVMRVAPMLRRFGPTTSAVVISQGFSATSIFLLPLLGFHISDLYAVAIQVGTGVFNGFVMGVLYLLALGRSDFRGWIFARIFVLLFSVVLSVGGAFLVASKFELGSSFSSVELGLIFLAFGIGGAFLGLTGVEGVRQACMGRPLLLAGSTIPANMVMTLTIIGIVLAGNQGRSTPFVPALAWMTANILFGTVLVPLLIRRADDTGARPPSASESRGNIQRHSAGLVIGVVTGTIYPIIFISATGQIKEGAATLLFLVSRIGSSVIGILINSVLLVQHNWSTAEERINPLPFRLMTAAVGLTLAAILLHRLGVPPLITYAPTVAGWLATLAAAPFVLRETNRRRLGSTILTKSVLDICVSTLSVVILLRNPTVTGYFGAYSLSQSITCFVCAIPMGDRYLKISSAVMTAISFGVLLVLGW